MYSPTQGRFTTIDPTGFQAGDVNLYRFVGNDPTNRVDPSGLAEVPGAWPAADSIRTEPKYTKHDVEWYATLFNVTNPDKPRIALASYFGFDVEVKNGQPALKKTPVAGVDVTGPRDSKLTILSNYVTRTKEVGGQKYLVVKYAILVTDKANDKYNAHLFANWQFSVTGNKLVSEFLVVSGEHCTS
jgi:uncharacterized protein RhaS with RHS repeats